ncbi:MAG: DUF5698 domain-containing protein [Anaerolineales bacterium]|jgi:uncharacterized protein YebE (UPF0316 family)
MSGIEALFFSNMWVGALLIFSMRVVNMSLDTIRVKMVVRGRKGWAWVMGFIQTVIMIYVLSAVIQEVDNPLNIVAYAGGFATGNVVGMWIEDKMAMGHTHMRVISPTSGLAIAEKLRDAGYAVTEISGRGRDGTVTLLNVSVLRKNKGKVSAIVQQVDEGAFITEEELRPVRRGYWGV